MPKGGIQRERAKMNNIEEHLQSAKELGFAESYLELMGGGALAIWIPLQHTVYEYALLNEIGLGVYPHGWDGDQVEMFYYGEGELEEPTPEQVVTVLEELKSTLERAN